MVELKSKNTIYYRGHRPHYLETAVFGRKRMNLLLLQMASMKSPNEASKERTANVQAFLKEQTKLLLAAFLDKEELENPSTLDSKFHGRLKSLVKELMAGYDKLPDENFELMSWLNSVLIACSTTTDEDIRLAIQKLVKKATQSELR
jgi:hypothetical protein